MELSWLKDIAGLLKDVRLSLFLMIAACLMLYLPFDTLDLNRPAIIDTQKDVITIVGILASANLAMHFLHFLWRKVQDIRCKRNRKTNISKVFYDLNFDELCVLYYCTQAGIRAFKAAPNSVIIMSLKAKGCIHHVQGIQSALEMHFGIFDDIYEIVRKDGQERFPKDFLEQFDWKEEVSETFHNAINWRNW